MLKIDPRLTAASLCGLIISLSFMGCSSVKTVSSHDIVQPVTTDPGAGAPAPGSPLPVIYVEDFDIDPDGIEAKGLLQRLRAARSGPSTAQHLVDLMAQTIVEDLAKKGLEAHRLRATSRLPVHGWLIRGVFLRVDEGSRLRRAVIGFGSGHTDLQVATAVDHLSLDRVPQPMYETDTAAASGTMPGAVITLNPYAAAFKFIIATGDLDKNTKDTAAKIADAMIARLRTPPGAR